MQHFTLTNAKPRRGNGQGSDDIFSKSFPNCAICDDPSNHRETKAWECWGWLFIGAVVLAAANMLLQPKKLPEKPEPRLRTEMDGVLRTMSGVRNSSPTPDCPADR